LEGLLKLNPHANVLISSGYSIKSATSEALEAGAKGFVAKPYEVKQILKVVREVLDRD
ncbi:MAG: hybrid sensor histidine kinase/response regulator, partial [Deltaproteobacteria bacterium]|nr:hybrid sensor histidine kinase/response regulator [Deltaproteobacteria bacterium]